MRHNQIPFLYTFTDDWIHQELRLFWKVCVFQWIHLEQPCFRVTSELRYTVRSFCHQNNQDFVRMMLDCNKLGFSSDRNHDHRSNQITSESVITWKWDCLRTVREKWRPENLAAEFTWKWTEEKPFHRRWQYKQSWFPIMIILMACEMTWWSQNGVAFRDLSQK